MNWLDWAILGIVVVSTLFSLLRGFVREAMSLAAWVIAFLVSTSLSPRFSLLLTDYIANDELRHASAYVILFAATLMLGSLLNALLAQFIRATGLTGADRLLGTAFGLARGLLLVVVLVFVLQAVLNEDEQSLLQESRLVPHLAMVKEWAQETFAASGLQEKASEWL